MKFFSNLISRHKVSTLMWIVIFLFLTGGLLRFAYVWEVGQHPFLNLNLPKSDLFAHDLMARNLIHPNPFKISASIYPITVHYIALIYRLFCLLNKQI